MELKEYIRKVLKDYYTSLLRRLDSISVDELLLKRNPYVMAATCSSIEKTVLDMVGYSILKTEETKFGEEVFEKIIKFLLKKRSLEINNNHAGSTDVYYVEGHIPTALSIKSGPNWGNKAQKKDENRDMSMYSSDTRCITGCCYGRGSSVTNNINHERLYGQELWAYVSGGQGNMYIEIIKIIVELRPEFHSYIEKIESRKCELIDECLKLFEEDVDGVPWTEIVRYNSGTRKFKSLRGCINSKLENNIFQILSSK